MTKLDVKKCQWYRNNKEGYVIFARPNPDEPCCLEGIVVNTDDDTDVELCEYRDMWCVEDFTLSDNDELLIPVKPTVLKSKYVYRDINGDFKLSDQLFTTEAEARSDLESLGELFGIFIQFPLTLNGVEQWHECEEGEVYAQLPSMASVRYTKYLYLHKDGKLHVGITKSKSLEAIRGVHDVFGDTSIVQFPLVINGVEQFEDKWELV